MLCIIAVCLIMGIAFGHSWFYCNHPWGYGVEFGFDETNYIECAKRLINTGVFSFWGEGPDAYTTPGYVLWLAAFMRIFGQGNSSITAIRLVQSIFTAVDCLLVWSIGRKITNNRVASLVGSLFIAISCSFCYYARFILTEPLYHFLLLMSVDIILGALKPNNRPSKSSVIINVLCGLVLGFCILVRPPIAILLPFSLVMAVAIRDVNKRKYYVSFWVLLVLGVVIVLTPWTIRNFVQFHKFIPFCTQTNAFFAGFTDDPVSLGLKDPGTIIGNLAYLIEFIKKDPVGMLQYMTIKKFNFTFLGPDVLVFAHLEEFNESLRNCFVYIGGIGIVTGIFTKRYRTISLMIVFYMAMTFIVVPAVRYGLQFYPFLGLSAGLLLYSICRNLFVWITKIKSSIKAFNARRKQQSINHS